MSASTKSESVISTVTGKKVRTLTGQAILRNEQIEFYTFPQLTEPRSASWARVDGTPAVVCPLCGTRYGVEEGAVSEGKYRIDARGVVYPSLLCPNMSCDFDHYVLLQGWTGMGRFGRKKDNERGVIFYCMVWEKFVVENGKAFWKIQPYEYTHAVSEQHARQTFSGLITAEMGRIVGIAPSIDPHVSGDADPNTSILADDR